MKTEKRTAPAGEIRAVDPDAGIVEAYLTKWDSVDSYKSTFKRGGFKESFETRMAGAARRIRMLWNHSGLCGQVLDAREDEYGPWVRCQFNLETAIGRDAFAHVRAGDVDAFSFAFTIPPDGDAMKNGVREIRTVDVIEVGPVVFEANPDARITDVRDEDRSIKFSDTEMAGRRWHLLESLFDTLLDILYEGDGIVDRSANAIQEFMDAYLDWAAEYSGIRGDDPDMELAGVNPLAVAYRKFVSGSTPDAIAAGTAFTLEDLKTMARGELLPFKSRVKLDDHPDLYAAHDRLRRTRMYDLLDELRRGGLTDGDRTRLTALIQADSQDWDFDTFVEVLKQRRDSISRKETA